MTTAAKPNQANSTLLRNFVVVAVLASIAGSALLFDGGLFFLILVTYALGVALLSIWRIISSLIGVSDEDEGALESEAVRRRRELVAKRDIRFKIIEELKFDHNLGRISDADYDTLYKPAAIELLTAEKNVEVEEKEHRGAIEAELEKRLRAEGLGTSKAEEPAKAEPKKKGKEKAKATSAALCASCSKDIDPDSVFCKHCGHRQETAKATDE